MFVSSYRALLYHSAQTEKTQNDEVVDAWQGK